MKIYHNNRCKKSRDTLEMIKKKTSKFQIIEYLKKPLQFKELKLIILKLNIKAIDIVRTQESIWKEKYKNKKMSDDDIIYAIIKYPNLMQRPIVTTNKKAIIGRPPENVLNLIN